MTRPSFVLTNREVGAPDSTEAEVLAHLAATPVPASIYSLARLAQWHAAHIHDGLRATLEVESSFLTHSTFDAIKAACEGKEYKAVFRYSSILAAIRAVIARGRPSPASDPTDKEVESIGDALLQLNRLVAGDNSHVLLVSPDEARKEWLGEMTVAFQEHPPTPTFISWAIGVRVFRTIAGEPAFVAMDALLKAHRRPTLARLFGGLSIWFGYAAQSDLRPHLWRIPELATQGPLERAAAFLARRLCFRRCDGPALTTEWLGSPTAAHMTDRPFFMHRGTAVVVDPFSLAELASTRFGRLPERFLPAPGKRTPAARTLGEWGDLWRKTGFERFVFTELEQVAAAIDEPPHVAGYQPCDAVARFGRDILFAEVKVVFPSPSTRRLQDRSERVDRMIDQYGAPGKDGICQTLSTMKWAISHRAALPNANPNGDDRWWSVIVSSEQVPMTKEWRTEWRRVAEAIKDRPGIHPFHGPVFLNLHEFCWLIEGARQGKVVGDLLAAFLAGNDISFGNFAARVIGRGIPNWLDASVKDSMAWLTDEIARSAKSRRPRAGRSTR